NGRGDPTRDQGAHQPQHRETENEVSGDESWHRGPLAVAAQVDEVEVREGDERTSEVADGDSEDQWQRRPVARVAVHHVSQCTISSSGLRRRATDFGAAARCGST